MRAARKLAEPTALESSEAALATAQTAADVAETALSTSRAAEREALERYDGSGDQTDETSALRARIARERAERLHSKRLADLAITRDARDAEQRRVDERELAVQLEIIGSASARLAPSVRRLLALDHQLPGVVDEFADVVAAAEVAGARAGELAERLGCPHRAQVEVPTLAWARRVAQVAVHLDRVRGGRDVGNGWLDELAEPQPDVPARGTPPPRNLQGERLQYADAVRVVETILENKEK